MRLEFSDQANPPSEPYVHVNRVLTATGGPLAPNWNTNPNMWPGGSISGHRLHDGDGIPVEGCSVSVARKAMDPSMGEVHLDRGRQLVHLHGCRAATTPSAVADEPELQGQRLADYNPGWLLPEKYKDYYRRTYKNQPLVDSLNTSATPIGGVVDHTPVAVTAPSRQAGIDETISPAATSRCTLTDPSIRPAPCGATSCTAQGPVVRDRLRLHDRRTFQKAWKVLPTGTTA